MRGNTECQAPGCRLIGHVLHISAPALLDELSSPPQWLTALPADAIITYRETAAGIEIIDPAGVSL